MIIKRGQVNAKVRLPLLPIKGESILCISDSFLGDHVPQKVLFQVIQWKSQ